MDVESAAPGSAASSESAAAASSSSASASSATASSAAAAKRVRVKKWNAVAFWSYDIENDTCAICHNQLMVPCIECEAEPHRAEDCNPVWGSCHHSYHFHCISRWLKTRSTCPLDDQEWDFAQYSS